VGRAADRAFVFPTLARDRSSFEVSVEDDIATKNRLLRTDPA
jgi:hypothetical protein